MRARILSAMCLVGFLAGCNSYVVPGGPASLEALGVTPDARAALTDQSVQTKLSKKPLAAFPATIAVARVQAADYASYSYRYNGSSRGGYSVVSVRDIEKDEDFETLMKLRRVDAVAGIKRILVDREPQTDLQLRDAAAKLHANFLLFYTLDTAFETEERVRPLSVITLGIFPNQRANVVCTASAVLMDVRNGYIYSVVETTAKNDQLANAWSSEQAMDDARKKAEREAFEKMLAEFKSTWPGVLAVYDRPVGVGAVER